MKKKTDSKRWTAEQIELLADCTCRLHWEEAFAEFCRLSKKMGFPPRTKSAARMQSTRIGISRKPSIDNMTPPEWAKALGINPARVRRWAKSGKKESPGRKVGRRYWTISCAELKRFAIKYPQRFADASQEALEYFFGKELTAKIAACKLRTHEPPIIEIGTGRIFSTAEEAAQHCFFSAHTIRRSLKIGDGRFRYWTE